jgi:hypothetical protein
MDSSGVAQQARHPHDRRNTLASSSNKHPPVAISEHIGFAFGICGSRGEGTPPTRLKTDARLNSVSFAFFASFV